MAEKVVVKEATSIYIILEVVKPEVAQKIIEGMKKLCRDRFNKYLEYIGCSSYYSNYLYFVIRCREEEVVYVVRTIKSVLEYLRDVKYFGTVRRTGISIRTSLGDVPLYCSDGCVFKVVSKNDKKVMVGYVKRTMLVMEKTSIRNVRELAVSVGGYYYEDKKVGDVALEMFIDMIRYAGSVRNVKVKVIDYRVRTEVMVGNDPYVLKSLFETILMEGVERIEVIGGYVPEIVIVTSDEQTSVKIEKMITFLINKKTLDFTEYFN